METKKEESINGLSSLWSFLSGVLHEQKGLQKMAMLSL